MKLPEERAIQIIQSAGMKRGIDRYLDVMERYQSSNNVLQDKEFQRKYKGFYAMGRKSSDFYQTYFSYMNLLRNKELSEITFEEIFEYIKECTRRNEASFSSKMLHTLDNNQPILDRFVLQNLNLYKAYQAKNSNKIAIYKELSYLYNGLLDDNKTILDFFDVQYPIEEKKITKVKKIDFVLWQMR